MTLEGFQEINAECPWNKLITHKVSFVHIYENISLDMS